MTVKPKLLLVTSSFPRWEKDISGRFILDLAIHLRDRFSITVLTPSYYKSNNKEKIFDIEIYRYRYFVSRYEKLGGEFGILPSLAKNRMQLFLVPFFILGQFLALVRICLKNRPHVIHAHWIIPQGFICAIVSKLFSIPLLITSHGGDIFGLQGKFLRKLKKFTCDNAQHITVVSNAIKKEIIDKLECSSPITVIPMGVDENKFNLKVTYNNVRTTFKIPGEMLLFVGRLSEKKGVSYLLQAMPSIIQVFPNITLIIVGDGEEKENLECLKNELKIGEHVIFAGKVVNDDLINFYKSADVFIGPSIEATNKDKEGLGLTFVEAAMSGCLVVGTNIGGISDIIENGNSGFLVPQKNSKAISETVIAVLNNLNELEVIKQKAYSKCVNKFGLNHIAKKYSELLNSLFL